MKLKPYPEYKDSGVPWLGKVPKNWEKFPGMAILKEKQIKNISLKEKNSTFIKLWENCYKITR
jgi:type I restriction enzyme S subunit